MKDFNVKYFMFLNFFTICSTELQIALTDMIKAACLSSRCIYKATAKRLKIGKWSFKEPFEDYTKITSRKQKEAAAEMKASYGQMPR